MARDITKLHPRLQILASQLVAEAAKQGLKVKITDCVRSAAEQADCVRRKVSSCPYPWSHHNWGTAFDICRNDGKDAYYNADGWFEKVGRIGQKLGLEWGGAWTSPVDRPHFQLPDWGTGCGNLIKTYGTPEKFWTTWGNSGLTGGKLAVDGYWGTGTTTRLQQIFGTPVDGIVSHQYAGWRLNNPGISGSFQWEDNPQDGSALIRAIQRKVEVTVDGFIGPDTIRGMQRWMGTEVDGFFSGPSACIKALQQWCNNQ